MHVCSSIGLNYELLNLLAHEPETSCETNKKRNNLASAKIRKEDPSRMQKKTHKVPKKDQMINK